MKKMKFYEQNKMKRKQLYANQHIQIYRGKIKILKNTKKIQKIQTVKQKSLITSLAKHENVSSQVVFCFDYRKHLIF